MKGIEKTAVFIVVAAIFGIVTLFIMLTSGQKVLAFILEKFGLTPPLSPLEKAILCSYYRCVDGCGAEGADTTQKYCADLYEGSWADVCSKPELAGFAEGDDLKVCGWNAMQYPIELKGFSEDKEIGKQIVNVKFDCIIPGDSKKMGINQQKLAALLGVGGGAFSFTTLCIASIATLGWTILAPISTCGFAAGSIAYLFMTGQTYYNNIFILDASIIKWRETSPCDKSGFDIGRIEDAIEKFKVSTNKRLYIFTDHTEDKFIAKYGDRKMTTISTLPTYYLFDPNVALSYQDILEEPEGSVKKYRAVTDKGEYIFWIDINSEIGTPEAEREIKEGITSYECKEPYWVIFYAKNLASGETKFAEFRNLGDKHTLFNFEIAFNEWKEKECKLTAESAYAYGLANFTITYLASTSS
jgi:hypothetical protein